MNDNSEFRDNKQPVFSGIVNSEAGRDRRRLFRRLVALAGLGITGVLLSQNKARLLPTVSASAALGDVAYADGSGGLLYSDNFYWDGITAHAYGTLAGAACFVGRAGVAGAIPIIAEGYSGQTADLQQWQNASQTALSVVDKVGSFRIDAANTNNGSQLNNGSSTGIGLIFGGAASGEGISSNRNGVHDLEFWTNSSSSVPRMTISNAGNVGIGTTTPAYPLDIASSSLVPFRVSASTSWPGFLMVGGTSGSGMNGMEIQNSTGYQYNLGIGGHTNTSVPDTFFIYDNNTSRFALSVTSADYVGIGTTTPTHLLQLGGGAYCDGSGAWIAGSSIRWKENIIPLTGGVETIKRLHPVTYNRKETPGKTTMGFIAEEVGKVLPTVVDWDSKEAGYAEGYDHLAILALTVQAIKELEAENSSLRDRIEILERKLGTPPRNLCVGRLAETSAVDEKP